MVRFDSAGRHSGKRLPMTVHIKARCRSPAAHFRESPFRDTSGIPAIQELGRPCSMPIESKMPLRQAGEAGVWRGKHCRRNSSVIYCLGLIR